jgi:hypothetical protein
MRATDLAILGIIIMGCLALAGSLITIMVNGLTVRDPDVFKSSLVIAAISGSAVSGLVGYIGGYHAGKADTDTIKTAMFNLDNQPPPESAAEAK